MSSLNCMNLSDRMPLQFTGDADFYQHLRKKCNNKILGYEMTNAPLQWHLQQSITVDIHGPLKTRGETRCPEGI